MKVYFAGSIRGGRADAARYRRMIAHIRETDTVLTEHVGDLSLEGPKTDDAIYREDTAWIREADLVIAECTCPSLGVGYELAFAEALGKPCHIFYRGDLSGLSAMLTGNPYFLVYGYETEEEMQATLDRILREARNSERRDRQ